MTQTLKQIQDDLDFVGTMNSADIFPDFKEKLVLQEDKSLGFIHNTPDAGYPTYQEKGNFKGEMNLSNKGLFGKGNVTYKWASIDADKITFKPDQLLTSAKNFDVSEVREATVSVPQVTGYDVSIDWKPYQDSMFIQSLEKPFEMFKEPGYTLENLLILTPDGIKGRGTFTSDRGILDAKLISFEAFAAQSDTSNLQIKASGVDHLALDTKNVYAKLDFDEQMGYVKANKEDIITTRTAVVVVFYNGTILGGKISQLSPDSSSRMVLPYCRKFNPRGVLTIFESHSKKSFSVKKNLLSFAALV